MRMRIERNLSEHTISAYRDTFRLLLNYTERILGITPDKLSVQNIDEGLVSSFLTHLENERRNCIRTRNSRLSAIHSFFSYVGSREPDLLYHCQQILNLPTKKSKRHQVQFLNEDEVNALLSCIDGKTWYEKRDMLLIRFMIETGVRVSELTKIKIEDLTLSKRSSVNVEGKGRKPRHIPIVRETAQNIETWANLTRKKECDYLFSPRNNAHNLSRDSIARIIKKYCTIAKNRKGIKEDKSITPHTLRHTCAMRMLSSGVGLPLISLWLGHENISTTMVYVHADMRMKRKALELVEKIPNPVNCSEPEHEKDQLRSFLEHL